MRIDPLCFGDSILLAVSGGVDSMVMAELFVERCRKVMVAHCNFHLRGRESDDDEAAVCAWAQKKGVPCVVKDFNTKDFAQERGISVEMAARELRYGWFDKLCRENGFDGTCVAHNANDNAETLILNLLRGTGIRGVCGMSKVSSNPYGNSRIFRPLLSFTREEIVAFARSHGITWREDSTNAVSDCKRNLIRNKLFPLMAEINPSFIKTLNRDMVNFSGAADVLADCLEGPLDDLLGRKTVAVKDLKANKHWEYLFFEWMEANGFNPAVTEDAIDALKAENGILSGKQFLGRCSRLITTSSSLTLVPYQDAVTLSPKLEIVDWMSEMSPVTERGVILFDAAKISAAPTWRNWRDGDWLKPIGMRGKKKVSDMLTELKYNIYEKSQALVLVSSDDIDNPHVLAVIGERVDDSVKLSSSTVKAYRISIR